MNKKYAAAFATLALVATSLLAVPALAETNTPEASKIPPMGKIEKRAVPPERSLVGTVASVNGTTLTVTVKMSPRKEDKGTSAPLSTTYTVDTSKAIVMKAGSKSTANEIAVGDMIMVMGVVNNTSITAERIMDGFPKMGPRADMKGKTQMENPVITGNGQPVIAGTVTAISGTTITLTNKSVTYTVDATNTKIEEAGTESALSNVAIGDMLIVQGTVSGTTVTASSIIDQKIHTAEQEGNSQTDSRETQQPPAPKKGILSQFGGFFTRLFGF